MGKFVIVLGFILVLVLAWSFLMPGAHLSGQRMISRILPESFAPPQHVMNPPFMFDVTNANTVVHLP
jgi:hypothetical protein